MDFLKVLQENPGLKSKLEELLSGSYPIALVRASAETGLDENTFPTSCPWNLEEITTIGFYPE
jgi:hypothetical protein